MLGAASMAAHAEPTPAAREPVRQTQSPRPRVRLVLAESSRFVMRAVLGSSAPPVYRHPSRDCARLRIDNLVGSQRCGRGWSFPTAANTPLARYLPSLRTTGQAAARSSLAPPDP